MEPNDAAAQRRQRLRLAIATWFGGNDSALARAVGRSPTQIADMLAGRKAFGEKVARAFELRLAEPPCNMPPMWLDLPMQAETSEAVGPTQASYVVDESADALPGWLTSRATQPSNVEPGPDLRPTRIPVISWVRAGSFCEAIDNLTTGDAEDWKWTTQSHGPRAFGLRVRGDSMLGPPGEPSFSDGDIILVDPDREPLHRSFVVAKLPDDNEVTFKRLLIEGRRRYLQAINPSWPKRVIELPEDGTICGVVFERQTKV